MSVELGSSGSTGSRGSSSTWGYMEHSVPWNRGLGTELMTLLNLHGAISSLSVGGDPAPIPAMGAHRSDEAEPKRGWDGECVSTELELMRVSVLDPV